MTVVAQRSDGDTAALLDRAAVRSVLEAYFSGMDRRDWKSYGECFSEDARVEFVHDDAEVVAGRAAIVQRAERRRDRPLSNHLMSHAHIVVAGDRATAVTYAIAHLVVQKDGGARIVVRGLLYEDELAAEAGRVWRITRRSHRPLWQFEAPSMPPGY